MRAAERSTAPALSVTSAAIGYHQPLLVDVNLTVAKGEVAGILGRNGCGKSTLLRTIAGLTPALAGRIEMAGVAIDGWPAWRRAARGLVYLTQESRNFRSMTVRENLHLALWGSGSRWRTRNGSIDELLARPAFSRLPGLLRRRCGDLSGGQQMQLSIAKTMLRLPTVVLLDEPTAGLFEGVREELPILIGELSASAGVVLVEQSVKLVEQCATRMLEVAVRDEDTFVARLSPMQMTP